MCRSAAFTLLAALSSTAQVNIQVKGGTSMNVLPGPVTYGAQTAIAWFAVQPTRSFYVEPGNAFGLYGPMSSIEMSAAVRNEDSDRDLFLQPGFFQAITWELSQGSSRAVSAVSASWEAAATCGFEPCSLDLPIRLAPNESVTAVVIVSFGFPIEVGKHQILMDLKRAKPLAREADGSAWKGRLLERGSIDLDVRPVLSSQDRSGMHRVEAVRALRRKDYEESARQFQLMAEASPGNPLAFTWLGKSLMHLGRFSEAARAFEQALQHMRRGPVTLPARDLALAYAASGRESDAEQVLRRYHSSEEAHQLLQQVREAAKRLQSRR